MYRIAITMLTQDRARFLGMIVSLAFSALIVTQQAAIFIGLMERTYATITDTPQPDVWVMDPNVQMIDDINPLRDTDLFRVRSVEGVLWAVPMYKGLIKARMANGQFQTCNLIGIDDATLIGGPSVMVHGNIQDLRAPDAIIVDQVGAGDKVAQSIPGRRSKLPLTIGQQLELNDIRANVVGICDITRPFQSQPVIYTTYNRALQFTPPQRKMLSFVLVKAHPSITPEQLCKKIIRTTGLAAFTQYGFQKLTVMYYVRNTGIAINFGLAVLLGLLVGAALAGQIFYNFVSENLRYLALFSLMGAHKALLARMTLLQACLVAFLGWSIGCGLAALIGILAYKSELSFIMPWQLGLGSALAMLLISILTCLICINRIYKLEFGVLFKS